MRSLPAEHETETAWEPDREALYDLIARQQEEISAAKARCMISERIARSAEECSLRDLHATKLSSALDLSGKGMVMADSPTERSARVASRLKHEAVESVERRFSFGCDWEEHATRPMAKLADALAKGKQVAAETADLVQRKLVLEAQVAALREDLAASESCAQRSKIEAAQAKAEQRVATAEAAQERVAAERAAADLAEASAFAQEASRELGEARTAQRAAGTIALHEREAAQMAVEEARAASERAAVEIEAARAAQAAAEADARLQQERAARTAAEAGAAVEKAMGEATGATGGAAGRGGGDARADRGEPA